MLPDKVHGFRHNVLPHAAKQLSAVTNVYRPIQLSMAALAHLTYSATNSKELRFKMIVHMVAEMKGLVVTSRRRQHVYTLHVKHKSHAATVSY